MKVYIGPYPEKYDEPRVVSVELNNYDTWSVNTTLAHIIVPMLKQLKDTTHGAPIIKDEDVPEELRSTSAPPKENEWDIDDNHFKRWEWVMDEMIWAFSQQIDDSEMESFYTGDQDYLMVPVDKDGNALAPPVKWEADGMELPEGAVGWALEHGPNHTYTCDDVGLAAYQARKDNAFRLFGKYYENLWD